jgi:hypothetical protein
VQQAILQLQRDDARTRDCREIMTKRPADDKPELAAPS